MKKQNILFIYLPTGSGHYSYCKSIEREINSYNMPGVKANISYPLSKEHKIITFILEKLYKIASINIPLLWRIGYDISRLGISMNIYNTLISKAIYLELKEEILKQDVDKVISGHFLFNEVLYKVIRDIESETNKKIKAITLVTDPFSVPSVWAYKQKFTCIVNSELALEKIKHKFKLFSKKPYPDVKVFNHPVQSKFKEVSESDIQKFANEIGIDRSKFTLALLGGAEGIPKLKQLLKKFNGIKGELNLMILTGRNDLQYKYALSLAKPDNIHYYVFQYIDFVEKVLVLSDIVVTKAGPSSVFEILSIKKPLIISSYIYNQEKGTKDFIVNNNLGYYINKPAKLAKKIEELIENKSEYEIIKNMVESKEITSGAKDIANFIINY